MKWGNLIELKYGKAIRDRESFGGTVPVFGTNGQIGTTNEEPMCDHASFILGRKGAYRGVVFSDRPFSVIDTAFYAEPLTDELNLKWAYYKFLTYDINRMDSGSAIPSTDRNEIYEITVDLPPKAVQNKIVSILDALDDKIETNDRIIENLQKQVDTLFEDRFGRSEPSCCKLGCFESLINIASGKRPNVVNSEATTSCCIPLLGASRIMGYTSKSNCKSGALVIGRVGTHGVVQRVTEPSWASDNTLIVSSSYKEYVCQILRRLDYSQLNSGSTQPLITQKAIKSVLVPIPSPVLLDEFENIASALMNPYEFLWKENRNLMQLRDTLLPRLMSGELDMSKVSLDDSELTPVLSKETVNA